MSQHSRTEPIKYLDHVDWTLCRWRQSGHEWGESDCLLSVGDYLHEVGYPDICAWFRGTYDTEAGALAHMAAYGGSEGLLDLFGAPRTNEPVRGDVAVIQSVGALCTGWGYAMRLDRGVVEVDRRFVQPSAAWKVHSG